MPSTNGTSTATLPALGVEFGTLVEPNRLFVHWDDGKLFTPQDFEVPRVEEMLRVDGKAKTLEQVLTLPLRGAKWDITGKPGDSGQSDYVNEALTRDRNIGGMATPFDLLLSQMTAARIFRRVYFEKVFTIQDGRIAYDKIEWRPPATCHLLFDQLTGERNGFEQYVGYIPERPNVDERGYVQIPQERAFVFVHGQHRRPMEGVSDIDTAFQIFQTKQKVRWLWLQFLENQSMPKAIAKHNSTDDTAIQNFAKKIATLKGGGVVGISSDQSVEKFESSGSGASEYMNAMHYFDSEMSGSVLAGFTDLTAMAGTGRGSYALSKDATDLFLQACQAVLTEMASAVRVGILSDLVWPNFGVRAPVPEFSFKPIIREEAQASLGLLQAMANSATINPAIPVEFVQELVRQTSDHLGLDEAKIEAGFARAMANAQSPLAAVQQGVDHATRLVQEAQLQGNAPTSVAA